jgi:hypothetical protein
LRWLAECRDCTLSHLTPLSTAHLVRSFTSHVDRDAWRREHMAATGHWVGTRILRWPIHE